MPNLRHLSILAAVSLAAAASLSGCALIPLASAANGDNAFCKDFEAAGGSGAVPGVVPLFYPKEDLIASVDQGIAALAVEPPDEIAAEWTELRDFYADVKVAAEALEPGALLSNPELYDRSADLGDAVSTVSTYYFDHC